MNEEKETWVYPVNFDETTYFLMVERGFNHTDAIDRVLPCKHLQYMKDCAICREDYQFRCWRTTPEDILEEYKQRSGSA